MFQLENIEEVVYGANNFDEPQSEFTKLFYKKRFGKGR